MLLFPTLLDNPEREKKYAKDNEPQENTLKDLVVLLVNQLLLIAIVMREAISGDRTNFTNAHRLPITGWPVYGKNGP